MSEVEYDYEQKVQSSALDRVVYSNENEELYVVFPGGRVAGYKDVDPETVYGLVHSASVGSFYAKEIKGHYRGINTEDITFVHRKEKALAASNFPMERYASSIAPTAKFAVTFTVTVEIDAHDIGHAVSLVKQGNPGGVITEAKQV